MLWIVYTQNFEFYTNLQLSLKNFNYINNNILIILIIIILCHGNILYFTLLFLADMMFDIV